MMGEMDIVMLKMGETVMSMESLLFTMSFATTKVIPKTLITSYIDILRRKMEVPTLMLTLLLLSCLVLVKIKSVTHL